MRQPELDDIQTQDKSMNFRKVRDFWRDGKRSREIVWQTIQRKLRGRVGKKWNDVYSEMVNAVPPDQRKYIDNYVTLNCEEVDGKVYQSDGRELYTWQRRLYVNQHGILCMVKTKKHVWKREKPGSWITVLDKKKYYLAQDGCWWEIITKPCKTHYVSCGITFQIYGYDDAIFGNLGIRDCAAKYGERIYCVKRLQCGKSLCRRLNNVSGRIS